MSILYDLMFCVFAALYFPYVLVKGKWHGGFSVRFGKFPEDLRRKLKAKENIWIHAVSVGEVLSVVNLIADLKKVFPFHGIVLSVVTKTGYALANEKFPNDVVVYAPLDFSVFVRRFIACIRPKIYIAAETELWPNLFLALQRNKIPVVVVNGRISDSAYRGYKIIKPLIRDVLRHVDAFCMQTKTYAQRITAIGARADRVHVVGNIKFDDLPSGETLQCKDLGISDQSRVLVAGSTHPGEEEIILDIYKSLLGRFSDFRLIIAPRHVERAAEVMDLTGRKGFVAARFSELKNFPLNQKPVIIVDTIGHLKSLYRLATLVFVGKSLTSAGGHNIIEPAFFAKAVLVGPHMENFQDIMDMFLEAQAVVRAADAAELRKKIEQLLTYPKDTERIGLAAQKVVEQNRGTTVRTMHIVTKIMAESK